MRRIASHLLPAALLLGVGACTDNPNTPSRPELISQIRGDLPHGWDCTVVRQDEGKGHPHGLEEPLFRADFGAPNQSFRTLKGDRRERVSPLIQLYFYNIKDKPHVLEVIERERFYSWDIPIYFGETEEYIIVTSPGYVNHGVFTEEARQTIRPIWNVLRKYIENKRDETVEQLAQPDK